MLLIPLSLPLWPLLYNSATPTVNHAKSPKKEPLHHTCAQMLSLTFWSRCWRGRRQLRSRRRSGCSPEPRPPQPPLLLGHCTKRLSTCSNFKKEEKVQTRGSASLSRLQPTRFAGCNVRFEVAAKKKNTRTLSPRFSPNFSHAVAEVWVGQVGVTWQGQRRRRRTELRHLECARACSLWRCNVNVWSRIVDLWPRAPPLPEDLRCQGNNGTRGGRKWT